MNRVVALSGGVGGAKLALGLNRILPAGALTVVANTGDDFDHLGLRICPDIDTLMYVLAGLDDTERGWGRAGECWDFMGALRLLGGPAWFQLGDADLATHVLRTQQLSSGETLSGVTLQFFRSLGIAARVVPMSNDPVRTQIRSSGQWMDFQDYFVRHRCEPVAEELRFKGADTARPHPEVLEALRRPGLDAVVICPSNPFLSIAPILAMPGMREALRASAAPVIAVSPIIGGQAVKGPTAKLMKEFGLEPSAPGIAAHYGQLIDILVADKEDAHATFEGGVNVVFCQTWMRTLNDREALARQVLALADAWRRR